MEFKEAVDKFLKNPYWKGIYDDAPAKCKEFYEQHFAYSLDAVDKEEHERTVIDLYKAFSAEDWDYLINHTENQMGKWGYQQARSKYEQKQSEK